ncbi:ABC transporter permease [Phycisphaeraceae bacterium D3-23]
MPEPDATPTNDTPRSGTAQRRVRGDVPFFAAMVAVGSAYLLLIVAMLWADWRFTSLAEIGKALRDDDIRFSIALSLITCTISAILSIWVAVPIGYLMSRYRFPGKKLIDTVLDIPIVLPPLVIGISLLILFQTPAGRWLDGAFSDLMKLIGADGIRGITYEIPAVILAQFTVAAAFATRTMRVTFEQIDPRPERVALTLGAGHATAFSRVALPQSYRGMTAAFTLAWARSLGEFGPILIFAGTTRMKTEVLSTSVYLEFSIGNIHGAVAVSMLMVALAMVVLLVTRLLGVGREVV